MEDSSIVAQSTGFRWWLTALSVLLSVALLVPGAVFGILAGFYFSEPGSDDMGALDAVVLMASFGAFIVATFAPHLILKQGADHRMARLIFAGLCVLAVAGLSVDYFMHGEGLARALLGAPTGHLALNVGLGLAAAIGGGLWGTWEATKPLQVPHQVRGRKAARRR